MMKISVVLCTFNRCETLPKALESATALTFSGTAEWEVLVVDNNSTDRTREVVEEFCERYPACFRYLFEPKPGKSYALNSGIREAKGDIVAFMDDDVIVEANWLESLTASLSSDKRSGAGGRILPIWFVPIPRWLPRIGRYALAPLALFDLGLQAGELREAPFGTNMAFRKSMFEKYGGFRTDLGPNPNDLVRGEDTEFGSRLLAAGERLFYEPAAVVYHPVAANRVRKSFFLAWWFAKGRAEVREHGIEPNRICFHGIPLVYFRRLGVWTLRWMVAANPRVRFERKINVWINAGMITECYRRSRDATTS